MKHLSLSIFMILINGCMASENIDRQSKDSLSSPAEDKSDDSQSKTEELFTATDLKLAAQMNTPLELQLAFTAKEKTGITFFISENPKHGVLKSAELKSGSFTYSPEKDFIGTDSFKYSVTDGDRVSKTGTVDIEVHLLKENKFFITTNSTDLEVGKCFSVNLTRLGFNKDMTSTTTAKLNSSESIKFFSKCPAKSAVTQVDFLAGQQLQTLGVVVYKSNGVVLRLEDTANVFPPSEITINAKSGPAYSVTGIVGPESAVQTKCTGPYHVEAKDQWDNKTETGVYYFYEDLADGFLHHPVENTSSAAYNRGYLLYSDSNCAVELKEKDKYGWYNYGLRFADNTYANDGNVASKALNSNFYVRAFAQDSASSLYLKVGTFVYSHRIEYAYPGKDVYIWNSTVKKTIPTTPTTPVPNASDNRDISCAGPNFDLGVSANLYNSNRFHLSASALDSKATPGPCNTVLKEPYSYNDGNALSFSMSLYWDYGFSQYHFRRFRLCTFDVFQVPHISNGTVFEVTRPIATPYYYSCQVLEHGL
jgi:hypothetical protein